MNLRTLSLDELTIDDEASFRHIALYGALRAAMRRSQHRFCTAAPGERLSWDRALFLNLTYWSGAETVSVICDEHISPDVIAHEAWHHVVGTQLARLTPPGPPSAAAGFFAESIASAFDLYLVGRLIDHAPDCDFITTQVPIMAEAAEQAGLAEDDFAALMKSVAEEPERAFEDLRGLLFDAVRALHACKTAAQAHAALESYVGHRFEPLLHHYQLSNWILHTRAYASSSADEAVLRLDRELRASPDSLDWLATHWLQKS